ncbi:HTH domain-containing protein [Pediococcus stilesii]|uniref:HTH domain-containing protein n=1 Tax=Pediococcus stilesii TaxID=331679 RepID=A0A5R9BZ88_9LACO|nr:HTH domain-containing protein [Pediococcus stilesii]TLQ05450.1 HTH domain-containing protein [Pediococcus stilesii]
MDEKHVIEKQKRIEAGKLVDQSFRLEEAAKVAEPEESGRLLLESEKLMDQARNIYENLRRSPDLTRLGLKYGSKKEAIIIRRSKVDKLRQEGHAGVEIAEMLNVKPKIIQNDIAKIKEIEKRNQQGYVVWSEDETNFLIKSYQNGVSPSQIAQDLGRTKEAVYRKVMHLKEQGVIASKEVV